MEITVVAETGRIPRQTARIAMAAAASTCSRKIRVVCTARTTKISAADHLTHALTRVAAGGARDTHAGEKAMRGERACS